MPVMELHKITVCLFSLYFMHALGASRPSRSGRDDSLYNVSVQYTPSRVDHLPGYDSALPSHHHAGKLCPNPHTPAYATLTVSLCP